MMAFRSSAVRSVSSLALIFALRASKMWSNFSISMCERHFAEHLNEAAVAIVSKARIAGLLRQTFGGLIVQAQVQDGVHHAGHGELRAGAHAEQQRIVDAAELLAHQRLRASASASWIWSSTSFGTLLPFSKKRLQTSVEMVKHRRNGHARLAHFREASAFAAEHVPHLAVAVGRASAKRVNVFLHSCLNLLTTNISVYNIISGACALGDDF